jgi:ATP-dependent helicase HrpA
MTFKVGDAESKDLDDLKERLRDKARAEVAAAADDLERHGLTSFDMDELPKVVRRTRSGHEVDAYPALVDEGPAVGVAVFDTAGEQWGAMWRGTRKLLRLTAAPPLKAVQGRLSNQVKLSLSPQPAWRGGGAARRLCHRGGGSRSSSRPAGRPGAGSL